MKIEKVESEERSSKEQVLPSWLLLLPSQRRSVHLTRLSNKRKWTKVTVDWPFFPS